MQSSLVLIAASAAIALADTISVAVGQGGLTFTPDDITADLGDKVQFKFSNSRHTVVQGQFSTPCNVGSLDPPGGFNSGFLSSSGGIFEVIINTTDPIYFYCGLSDHCKEGMVGAINAATDGDTVEAYKAGAANASSTQQEPGVSGGTFVFANSSSTASSSPASIMSADTSRPISTIPTTSVSGSTAPTVLTYSSATTTLPAEGTLKTAAPTDSSSAAASSSASKTSASTSTKSTSVPANGGSASGHMSGRTSLYGAIAGFLLFVV